MTVTVCPLTIAHGATTIPSGAPGLEGIAFQRRSPHLSRSETGCGAMGDHFEHTHGTRPIQRGRNWPGPWRRTPGRILGTSLVRLYQLTLSGFVGNSCRHLPTCSEYAHEAIARHGLWAGGWMGLFRVLRCGPFGTHGIDRVPETLAARYVWFMPWRYWQIGKKRGHPET